MLLGLNFVMLPVPDIEQARAFYTEKLGLIVEDQQPGFVQFKQQAGMGAIFALEEKSDAIPHQGIELWWMVDKADATYAALVSYGVEAVSQPTDEPFGRAFTIKDPAGNTLNMFQPPNNA
jgi:predicted enzyme related to lactoylglutathione lyase